MPALPDAFSSRAPLSSRAPRQPVAPVGGIAEAAYVSTSISIQPDLLAAAKRRAREQGMGLSTYLRGLMLRDLKGGGVGGAGGAGDGGL